MASSDPMPRYFCGAGGEAEEGAGAWASGMTSSDGAGSTHARTRLSGARLVCSNAPPAFPVPHLDALPLVFEVLARRLGRAGKHAAAHHRGRAQSQRLGDVAAGGGGEGAAWGGQRFDFALTAAAATSRHASHLLKVAAAGARQGAHAHLGAVLTAVCAPQAPTCSGCRRRR